MSNVKSNYISCIKINNVPILPPLITAEKSRELKKIKTQAIKIEKRIYREKELRLLINEYTNSVINSEQTEKKQTKTKEKKLVRNMNKPQLSCDIQSSQYINNECYVFDPKESNFKLDLDNSKLTNKDVSVLDVIKDSVLSPMSSRVVDLDKTFDESSESWLKKCDQSDLNETRMISKFVYNGDKIERTFSKKVEDVVERDYVETPPRLLRSNSYTLDAPSPALIQHLNLTITPRKKNNSLSTLNDTFEIVSDNKTDFDTSCTESELNKISDIENVTSDEKKLKQFIDNNVPNTQTEFLTDLTYISETSKKHCHLQEILKNIPEAYTKKIFEMLEKKHEERVDSMVILADFDEGLSKLENISTPVENKNISDYTIYCQDNTESYEENEENINRTFNSERENRAKIEEKAAIIITAAAKGFLVRRLLKTSKIRDLIETIKDALVCAMQLHAENIETIDKSDVELHRRLIQQVSAGCYAFYDVFFNTSVEERMAIIATDRQKKKEKLLRPSSNSSITSGRSTPRARRSMNSSFS